MVEGGCMRIKTPIITGVPQMDAFYRDVYAALVAITIPIGPWSQDNVSVGQTNVELNLPGTTNKYFVAPFKGNVVGISVSSNAARSNGDLTVKPTIDGAVSTDLSVSLNATNTLYHSQLGNQESNYFKQNSYIGVAITSSGSWAPTTADIVVNLFIKPGVSI